MIHFSRPYKKLMNFLSCKIALFEIISEYAFSKYILFSRNAINSKYSSMTFYHHLDRSNIRILFVTVNFYGYFHESFTTTFS